MGFKRGHKKFGGMKKGFKSGYSRETIEAAFEAAKVKHGGVSLLEHLCELAYQDDKIAVAMLKKLVPDLRSLQLQVEPADMGEYGSMTTAEIGRDMMWASDGTAHLMTQLGDLLGRIKQKLVEVGIEDDEFVAEIDKALETAKELVLLSSRWGLGDVISLETSQETTDSGTGKEDNNGQE